MILLMLHSAFLKLSTEQYIPIDTEQCDQVGLVVFLFFQQVLWDKAAFHRKSGTKEIEGK